MNPDHLVACWRRGVLPIGPGADLDIPLPARGRPVIPARSNAASDLR